MQKTSPAFTNSYQTNNHDYSTPANNTFNQLSIVGHVNFPTTQLFEATGFVNAKKKFPVAEAFLMFVPGMPDQSKTTNRTYDQAKKEVMKISIRDLFGLAEALNFAAIYGQNPDFQIFTDSTKFAGTPEGQGQTKIVNVGAAMGKNNKPKVFLTFKGGQSITIAMEKWHAVGLAEQLKILAGKTLEKKFIMEKNAN